MDCGMTTMEVKRAKEIIFQRLCKEYKRHGDNARVSRWSLPDELEWRFNKRNNPYLFRDTLRKLIGSENLPYRELVAQ